MRAAHKKRLLGVLVVGDIMGDEIQQWERKAHHQGIFGDYQMFGFQHESVTGKLGWLINVWRTNHSPFRTYWVEGEEFLLSKIHYGYNYTNRTLVETFGPATEIDPKEKQAILQAISEWKKD